jgi:hypothetical protein
MDMKNGEEQLINNELNGEEQLSNNELNGRIDLHLHSSNSDGDDTVQEVIQMAADEGLRVIAITDHNKVSISECMKVGDMTAIPGCEFSAMYQVPSREDATEVHIVGLFPDGVDPAAFDGLFEHIATGKRAYIRAILEQLERLDIHVDIEEVNAVQQYTGHTGRHQIAAVLIDKGYAKDLDDAFDHFIGNFSPYYVPSTRYIRYAPLHMVVRQIKEYGGIPILAHPYGYRLEENEIEELISTFQEMAGDIGGLEVYYERYVSDPERMEFLHNMAGKYNLLPSVGSDRHREPQPFATTEGLALYEQMLEKLHKPA